MMCLASNLQSRPYVIWLYSMNAVEVVLSLALVVHVAGSMDHNICWGLYPLSLKTVVRTRISHHRLQGQWWMVKDTALNRYNYPWNWQHGRRGITQKKAYNIQNMVEVWNQEYCWIAVWFICLFWLKFVVWVGRVVPLSIQSDCIVGYLKLFEVL